MELPKSEAEWQTILVGYIKAEMLRRHVSYAELSACLRERGYDLDRTTLSNRVNRGSFSAAFFCQVLAALGCGEELLQEVAARAGAPQ